MDCRKLIGLHLKMRIVTSPALRVDPTSLAVRLSDDGGNVNVVGLNRDLTILGAEAGAVVGLVFVAGSSS